MDIHILKNRLNSSKKKRCKRTGDDYTQNCWASLWRARIAALTGNVLGNRGVVL
jgi:hypothetical protein